MRVHDEFLRDGLSALRQIQHVRRSILTQFPLKEVSDKPLPRFGLIGAMGLVSAISCALGFIFLNILVLLSWDLIAIAIAINLVLGKSRVDRVFGGIKLSVAALLYTLFVVLASQPGNAI